MTKKLRRCRNCVAALFGLLSLSNALFGASTGRPAGYALVVGLDGFGPDADKMETFLSSFGYQITTLKDLNATHDKVLNKIDEIKSVLKKDDIFVFYYSGHGTQVNDINGDEPDGLDEALCTKEKFIIDDELGEKWISFTEGAKIFCITDACHSGSAYKTPNKPIFKGFSEKMKAGLIHFSAGTDAEPVSDRSLLTQGILSSWNDDLSVDYPAFFKIVYDWVQKNADDQHPEYHEYGGLNISFSGKTPFIIDDRLSLKKANFNISIGDSVNGAGLDINRVKVGDFNGDGKTDILYVLGWGNASISKIYLSNGSGKFQAANGPVFSVGNSIDGANLDINRIKLADFNDDGKDDILHVLGCGDTPKSKLYLSNGNGTFQVFDGPAFSVGKFIEGANVDINRIKLADFNGDGKADILHVLGWGDAPKSRLYLSNGSGAFQVVDGPAFSVGKSIEGANVDINRIKLVDFNGDGKADVLHVLGWGDAPKSKLYLSNGSGAFQVVDGPVFSVGKSIGGANVDINRIKLADFNGDGKADILHVLGWGDAPKSRLYLSNGSGAFQVVDGPAFYVGNSIEGANVDLNRIKIGDFNGDGCNDILTINGWGGKASSRYDFCTPDGLFKTFSGPAFSVGDKCQAAMLDTSRVLVGDYDGNKTKDLLWIKGWGTAEAPWIYFNLF